MRAAKNFVVNRGVSCFIRGVSCFIRGVSCFIRGVSCFIRCILSCFIRCNPVFQSWSSRRERVKLILIKQNEGNIIFLPLIKCLSFEKKNILRLSRVL